MELYEKVFGSFIPNNPTRTGNNIMINCPFHKDDNASLCISTDPNKPVFNCFGCGKKGSLIGAFMELNNLSYPDALKALDMDKPFEPKNYNKQIIVKEEPPRIDTDYSDYCFKVWNDTIMHDEFYEFYCKKLYELRGITMPTAVCCMIGYDPDKGWIFPVIRYKDKKIVGYEIREKHFQKFKFENGKETKCYKAKNTPSCLCWIYEAWDNKKCIINEGFVDSYFQYQYQYEKTQKFKGEFEKVDCSILTASCGVKAIPELVEQAKLWNDFEEIIFCLDNDEAGNLAKQKLLELPHENKFRFFNGLEENEDFEEYYKRVLVKELYRK